MFDTLVAKCPNPSCYSDLKLIYQDLELKQAKFKCIKRSCRIKEISINVTLQENGQMPYVTSDIVMYLSNKKIWLKSNQDTERGKGQMTKSKIRGLIRDIPCRTCGKLRKRIKDRCNCHLTNEV